MRKIFIKFGFVLMAVPMASLVVAYDNVAFWAGNEHYNFPDQVVSLTFDDGPDVYSEELYTYLNQQKVAATFFIIGHQNGRSVGMANYQTSTLQKLKNAHQRLGNHTHTHDYGGQTYGNDSATDQNILTDINSLQSIIDPYITNQWYFIRAPHNYPNITSYNAMPGIMRQFRDVEANYDSSDWAYASRGETAQTAMNALLNLISSRSNQGGIIQMHDANEFSAGSTFALDATKYLVPTLKQRGFVFAPPVLEFSESNLFTAYNGDFSDADGFGGHSSYYNTFKLADVNNDGKMDVLMRGAGGIYAALSYPNTLGFDNKTLIYSLDFTDQKGWKNSKYSSSIQYADINKDGRLDIIGRGSNGIIVAINNGNGFNSSVNMSFKSSNGIADFADNDGAGKWGNNASWYSTIRVVDINNDGFADIVARSSQGIWIAYGTGSGFQQKKLAFSQNFYDSTDDGWNWGVTDRAATIQYADVNGDGWLDIVGRGIWGIMVALNTKINGHEFDGVTATWWTSDFNNANSWNSNQYYKSVHFADINGDGMSDVIGRGAEGVWVALSNGTHFTDARLWSADYANINNWNLDVYNSSLQYGDVNGDGRADVIGRGREGVWVGLAP